MDTPDLGGDAGRSSQFFISKCYVAEGFVDTVYQIKEIAIDCQHLENLELVLTFIKRFSTYIEINT